MKDTPRPVWLGEADACRSIERLRADDPLDLVSGTLGLTGGVDGVLVLQREPVSDNATLYVIGRDIEEQGEHGLAWERNRARWTITGGDPRVARLGTEQKRVYELLTEAPRYIKELTAVLKWPCGDRPYQ